VHILGYFKKIDQNNKPLHDFIANLTSARIKRAKQIIKKLNSYGVEITFEEIMEEAGIGNIGRLHIANVIYKKKYVKKLTDVFTKYIGFNSPCFVPRDKLEAEDIIKKVITLGGVPVLAHPGLMGTDCYIEGFIAAGLKGIEVFYPLHSKKQIEKYKSLAENNGLIITGGSDCHGKFKSKEFIGKIKLEEKYLKELKEVL